MFRIIKGSDSKFRVEYGKKSAPKFRILFKEFEQAKLFVSWLMPVSKAKRIQKMSNGKTQNIRIPKMNFNKKFKILMLMWNRANATFTNKFIRRIVVHSIVSNNSISMERKILKIFEELVNAGLEDYDIASILKLV